MNYRKICTFALLCFMCITAYPENGIIIHQNDGTTIGYAFSDEPKISYVGETLIMSAAGVAVEFPLETLQKLTFTETTTDIPLIITTTKADGPHHIYTSDGRLVRTVPEGSQLTVSGLPVGIYVIHNNNISYKINITQ